MCLEEENCWTLYLRLPEISDDVRLHALRAASVEVDAGGTRSRVSLMELRPGLGRARVVVPPSLKAYSIFPGGSWPQGLPQERWQSTARGVNPQGTIFVSRRGEWVRLKEDSAVELGSEIRVVALSSNAPPAVCNQKGVRVVSHNRLNWQLWHVVLPVEVSKPLQAWADELEIGFLDPAWRVTIVSAPLSFDSGVPVFARGERVIAKLESPNVGMTTSVSLESGSGTERISLTTTRTSTGYLSFELPWAGSNKLSAGYDARSSIDFDSDKRPSLEELRTAICTSPALRMKVGENTLQPWSDPFELTPQKHNDDPPDFAIYSTLEDLGLELSWKGKSGDGSENSLTAEAVIQRLQRFWNTDSAVQVSAGTLGLISLHFRPAKKSNVSRVDERLILWAQLAQNRSADRKVLAGKSPVTVANTGLRPEHRGRWKALILSKLREQNIKD
jgi:hypothetical protein